MKAKPKTTLYSRIREILEAARAGVARSVNTAQVVVNWLIGREIVEEEQKGRKYARYGEKIIRSLAARLQRDFGVGYSATNLKLFRQFYLACPRLLERNTGHTLRDQFRLPLAAVADKALSRREIIGHTACDQSPAPGYFNPNLAWSLYRQMLKVDKPQARAFYEIEAIKHNWSARELERQINSLLYERLALSKDKKGLMRLATKGREIAAPADVFKDPVVIEFLGLPESPRLVETTLEEALINNLQSFLLGLGKGFAFVARQERITLDGDYFCRDLRQPLQTAPAERGGAENRNPPRTEATPASMNRNANSTVTRTLLSAPSAAAKAKAPKLAPSSSNASVRRWCC